MSRRFCAALALALGGPALACSLAISTDGLAGPPLEPDAAVEAGPDAAVAEAGADADADSGALQFCDLSPTATFCADFDHDANPKAGFTDEVTEGDYIFGLSNDAVSPPHAFSVEVSASGNGEISGRIYRDLGFVASALHLEVDVKLCPIKKGGLEILKVETSSDGIHAVTPGFESADIALGLTDGSPAVAVEYYDPVNGDKSTGFALTSPLPTGTWAHLALDVVFAKDPSGAFSLVVDRSATPSAAEANMRTLSTGPTAMRVIIGSFAYQTADACTTLYDNLVVIAQP